MISFLFCGCARITESSRIFLGTSTQALEGAPDRNRQSEVFNLDYPTAYRQVFNLLKKRGVYIFLHSQRRHRIVAMNFKDATDSTEVGIFFAEVSPLIIKITIASLSPSHLELAKKIIFSELQKYTPATIIKKEVGSENP